MFLLDLWCPVCVWYITQNKCFLLYFCETIKGSCFQFIHFWMQIEWENVILLYFGRPFFPKYIYIQDIYDNFSFRFGYGAGFNFTIRSNSRVFCIQPLNQSTKIRFYYFVVIIEKLWCLGKWSPRLIFSFCWIDRTKNLVHVVNMKICTVEYLFAKPMRTICSIAIQTDDINVLLHWEGLLLLSVCLCCDAASVSPFEYDAVPYAAQIDINSMWSLLLQYSIHILKLCTRVICCWLSDWADV